MRQTSECEFAHEPNHDEPNKEPTSLGDGVDVVEKPASLADVFTVEDAAPILPLANGKCHRLRPRVAHHLRGNELSWRHDRFNFMVYESQSKARRFAFQACRPNHMPFDSAAREKC
jgi:hypothetical protein